MPYAAVMWTAIKGVNCMSKFPFRALDDRHAQTAEVCQLLLRPTVLQPSFLNQQDWFRHSSNPRWRSA